MQNFILLTLFVLLSCSLMYGQNITNTTTTTTITTSTTSSHSSGNPIFNASGSEWPLVGAIPGLALTFAGYRFLGTTIFLVGAAVGGTLFYSFSPHIFVHTPFCCGDKGSLAGHIIVSVIVAIFCGLLARYLLRVGLFLIGMCFGLLVALGLIASPLHTIKFFHTNAAVITLYIACMTVFGVLTLFLRKVFVVITTSFGGALLFILGVDYFVHSEFSTAIEYAFHEFKEAIVHSIQHHDAVLRFSRGFSRDTYILLASWLVLAVLGVIVQYKTGERRSPVQKQIILVVDKDDDYDEDRLRSRYRNKFKYEKKTRRRQYNRDPLERESLLTSSHIQ